MDGPEELHVVLLDNGRSKLLGGRYQEMLNCIRCGACLNVCPVYRKAGGGRLRARLLRADGSRARARSSSGWSKAPALPHASSLCGACTAACPVKIPLHELLLELRRDLVEQGVASRRERLGVHALVARLVAAVELPALDALRPPRAAAWPGGSARAGPGRRAARFPASPVGATGTRGEGSRLDAS